MALTMIHPYYGGLVVCAEYDGEQHDQEHASSFRVDDCDMCGFPTLACGICRVVVACCLCSNYHAYECPWPL